jgi:ATP-binding cassette subfamily C protein
MSRVKTPTMLQMEATECGAAALGIVLGYYGCFVSLATLREACDVSRDGSKAINMLKVARQYGMEADAYEVSELSELTTLTTPSILFWAFNHFIVFEGCDDHFVYVNDPAAGHCMLDKKTFSEGFTGLVLVMKPTTAFKTQGASTKLWDMFKRRLGNTQDTLWLTMALGFALVVPGVLIPGFSRIFIDDILVKETQNWLVPFLVGMGITAIFRAGVTYFQQWQLLKWQTQRLAISSMQFVWHLMQLPLRFFMERYVGDIQERVAANERVAQWLSMGLTSSAVELTTLLFYALMMILFNVWIGSLGLLILLINAGFLYVVVAAIADTSYQYLQKHGRLTGLQVSGLTRMETIKSRGSEAAFFSRWAGMHAGVMNADHGIAMASLSLQWLPKALIGFANALFIGLGGVFVMRGQLSLGSLVALQSLFVTMQGPIQSLISMANVLPKIKGDFARIDDVLNNRMDTRYQQEQTAITEHRGDVRLVNVSFGYAKLEEPLIQQFNLNINAGSRVSVVGATGSGKSTIGKLVAGLLQPWSGEVLLGDLNTQTSGVQALTHQVALVEQENFLFEGTVRENLTLWNDGVSVEAMNAVLHEVGLFDLIQSRGGLEAAVKEGGINFSGGERQRFELARALLRNPVILVLDEATSALSEGSEKQVFNAILKRPCTLINIAHRLATVKLTDHIIVLDQGRIVQTGTHDALIQEAGLYQRLYQAESEGGSR